MWRLFDGVEHIPSLPITQRIFSGFSLCNILLFLVFLICILVKLILNLIHFQNDTTILDRYIRDYKISLGCITFGSLLPFLVISLFEIDSTTSTLCLFVCSMFPTVLLEVLVSSSLEHCNLDSTRLYFVFHEMKTTAAVSVFFTLMLSCFGVPNMGPNILIHLLQQVGWVLANLPYYIEFCYVMTFPINVSFVRNGNVVARNIQRNEPNEPNPNALNVRFVRNEDEEVMDNNRGSILDDSDLSDEPDYEQLPNYPAKVLIDSEDLQCNICFLPYSDKRVPLVLKECGHSMCKKCCKAAQRQLPYNRFISCPFCRTQTPGPIAMLPKNYTVMGIVQKIGQKVIRE